MARMNFSGNVVDRPGWLAAKLDDDDILRFPAKLNVAGIANQFGINVNVTAIAAQNATSIAVSAMQPLLNSPVPLISLSRVLIPAGTTLVFGNGKFATITADVKQGDTTIAVAALPTALAVNDNTQWAWNNRIYVQSGILLGRTLAQRDAGNGFVIGVPGTHDEFGILLFDLDNAQFNNDIELLAPGQFTEIYENWLPNYSTVLRPGGIDNAVMTYLRTQYRCILGIP